MEACGHCSSCQGRIPPEKLPSSSIPEITPDQLELIQRLTKEKHPGLRSARQLARFLCGMTSPATSYYWFLPKGERRKVRLTSHDAYSMLEKQSFQEVLELCEGIIIE